MQVSRGIKEAIKVSIEEMVVDSWGIEKVSRNNSSDSRIEARSIHQVSRSYRGGRSFLDRSTKYRGAVEKAIRHSWRILTDSKVSRRFRGGVEPLFKTSFSRVKNTDMNAIQHATQPMIQSTQQSLKIISQKKNLSTWISKTHTHTLNKSNQFYISKTKLRQFSKHTLTHVKPCNGQITLYLHMYQE